MISHVVAHVMCWGTRPRPFKFTASYCQLNLISECVLNLKSKRLGQSAGDGQMDTCKLEVRCGAQLSLEFWIHILSQIMQTHSKSGYARDSKERCPAFVFRPKTEFLWVGRSGSNIRVDNDVTVRTEKTKLWVIAALISKAQVFPCRLVSRIIGDSLLRRYLILKLFSALPEEHFERLKHFVASHATELREIEELFDESRTEVRVHCLAEFLAVAYTQCSR